MGVELPPLAPSLPAGFVTHLVAAAGAPTSGVLGVNIWSGVIIIIIYLTNNCGFGYELSSSST
jgi:hypothetical protein